jgi:serine/threonine protein phosphatase PrpC
LWTAWCETARFAFSSAYFRDASWKQSFLAAAVAVDQRWKSMSEDERWEQGWCGTAQATVVNVSNSICSSAWLGDCQMFQVREREIVDSTTPHTVFHALRAAGNKNADPKMKRVLLRWLSLEQDFDTIEWHLQSNDTILLCSSHVDESNVIHAVKSQPPEMLAQEIARLSGEHERRSSHGVLAIRWSVS